MSLVTQVDVRLHRGWAVRSYERGTGAICRVTMTKLGQADSIVRLDLSKPMFLDPLPAALMAQASAVATQVAESLEAVATSPERRPAVAVKPPRAKKPARRRDR